jgi:DnaK suppressor protein
MDFDSARDLLAKERARVERELADLAPREGDDAPDAIEGSDAGHKLTDAETDEGLRDRLDEDLAAIERAEKRLAEGIYGLSVESGEPIPDDRLQAIPWAERTTEEQARLDSPIP